MNVWIYHDEQRNIIRVFNKKEKALEYVKKVKKDYAILIQEDNANIYIRSPKNKDIRIHIMQRKIEGVLEPQQYAVS